MITSKGRKIQGTTQGLYAGTADGQLLASTNNRSPEKVLTMLKKALNDFKPLNTKVIEATENKGNWNPNLKFPEGGFCAKVNGRVLGGYEETDNKWRNLVQKAISRDNLWASKEEHESLKKGIFPLSLQKRIARFHLVDNTRGEPPMWKEDEIVTLDIKMLDGKVSGSVSLKSKDGSRSYSAEILGYIHFDESSLTRFDLVAYGKYKGEGPYTKGAPKGEFPYAVSISLADGTDSADKVPPQGSRGWVPGYMNLK